MAQATITKQAPKATKQAQAPKAKQAPKASPKAKQAQAPKALTLPAIVAACVEGIAQRVAAGSTFYARALDYHGTQKTIFPRARTAKHRAALTMEKITEIFRQHDARILAAGNGDGQAMFDHYMTHRDTIAK